MQNKIDELERSLKYWRRCELDEEDSSRDYVIQHNAELLIEVAKELIFLHKYVIERNYCDEK